MSQRCSLSSISSGNPTTNNRLSKIKDKQNVDFAIPVKKSKGEVAFYEVSLSPKGKAIALEFFKNFPEIIEYMKKNVAKWREKYMLPKVHDVKRGFIKIRNIYPGQEDPNVKLFKVYQWIMTKDASSLELVSSLSMVQIQLCRTHLRTR
jgi:xylose isomerase